MGRLIFLTFGAPYYIYSDAIKRIIKQAQEFNIFDEIIEENEVKLIDKHVDFWSKHGNFIKNNSRGFGYWLWKPYLINETLKKMNEDDILLYCDVGCELNKNGIENFNKLIEIVKIKKIIGFSAGSCDISHTKRDLSYQYNFNIRLLLVNHLQAGCLLIQKCKFIDMIMDEWYRTCEIYHNIDDSQSKILNFKNFMDHRHDQSVLNMILKKYKIINNFDCDYLSSNKNMITSPILYIRNKTGKSVL
jgi:hypothetical protein